MSPERRDQIVESLLGTATVILLALMLMFAAGMCARGTAQDSHAIIALQQSRSTGTDPSFELASLEFVFGYAHRVVNLAQVDIATTQTDSAATELTDAGFQVAMSFPAFAPEGERLPYVGLWLKLHETEPMVGPVVGSVELGGSKLHGSRMSMGALFRLRPSDVLSRANLFAEWLLHVETDEPGLVNDALRLLSFRGSFLVPFGHDQANPDRFPVAGKIAVIVPVSGVIGLGGG